MLEGGAVYGTPQIPMLEISIGNIPGRTTIEKFGRADYIDMDVKTDVWDGANSIDRLSIWVAPQRSRKHVIQSTNENDEVAASGARTLRIYGLPDWDTKEIAEDILLNGTNAVTAVNSYVIIHRMKILTKGSGGPNIGNITAVARVDNTLTAMIRAGDGQTQMAVYGIPSTQNLYMTRAYGNLIAANSGTQVKLRLLANPEPDVELNGFLVKHTWGIRADGTSSDDATWKTYKRIRGPAIIKIQAISNANNVEIDGGFEAIVIEE